MMCFILFYFISLRFDAFHWNLFIYLLEGGRVLSQRYWLNQLH